MPPAPVPGLGLRVAVQRLGPECTASAGTPSVDHRTVLQRISCRGDVARSPVVRRLWQATQIVIDLAMFACLVLRLGTPSYADAFRRLERADVVDGDVADRLVRAVGFRNLVGHAYESLHLRRVHAAATHGPANLLRFLGHLKDRVETAGS